MSTPHKATPEQWRHLENGAQLDRPYNSSRCLLELRDRLAALEKDATEHSKSAHFCFEAIIQRVEALEAAANLQQQDEDAERAMEGAPAGGLVELMRCAYESSSGTITNALGREELPGPGVEEFTAMLDVIADYLNDRGQHMAAVLLREEVERD